MNLDVIPHGYYCYSKSRGEGRCPYWSIDATKPKMHNGHCAFLGQGDWERDPFSLLWDQVKECGVNMYTAEEKRAWVERAKAKRDAATGTHVTSGKPPTAAD